MKQDLLEITSSLLRFLSTIGSGPSFVLKILPTYHDVSRASPSVLKFTTCSAATPSLFLLSVITSDSIRWYWVIR